MKPSTCYGLGYKTGHSCGFWLGMTVGLLGSLALRILVGCIYR